MLAIPQCIGAKHSSLSRQLEWDRLALRDAVRPDFKVFTGNDLAIDMVMYGSDYLLGLSTFAPDAFARRDRMWADGDTAFYELNDLLQYLGHFAFRSPVPGYRHDAAMFLEMRGWAHSDATPPCALRRPQSDSSSAGGHPRPAGALAVTYTKVKRLNTPRAFRSHLDELGITIPIDDEVAEDGVLAQPVEITDVSADVLSAPNRFAVLPMEGWDGTTDGRPTHLVRRRWGRFAQSGCGLVWGEATAVRRDGRANPHQLVIDESTVEDIAALRALLAPGQVAGMQLTHSGRWSRPEGVPAPRTAYRHPLLDARAGASAASVLSDGELDELVQQYVEAAVLARQAGFDFVDLKHCHGYLLHELLSARERPGRYGGDLAGRTRFLSIGRRRHP